MNPHHARSRLPRTTTNRMSALTSQPASTGAAASAASTPVTRPDRGSELVVERVVRQRDELGRRRGVDRHARRRALDVLQHRPFHQVEVEREVDLPRPEEGDQHAGWRPRAPRGAAAARGRVPARRRNGSRTTATRTAATQRQPPCAGGASPFTARLRIGTEPGRHRLCDAAVSLGRPVHVARLVRTGAPAEHVAQVVILGADRAREARRPSAAGARGRSAGRHPGRRHAASTPRSCGEHTCPGAGTIRITSRASAARAAAAISRSRSPVTRRPSSSSGRSRSSAAKLPRA